MTAETCAKLEPEDGEEKEQEGEEGGFWTGKNPTKDSFSF